MLSQLNRAFVGALAVVAAALAVAVPGDVQAQGADPAIYGALPAVSEVVIAPGGRYAAAIQNTPSATAVVIYDLDNPGAAPTGIALGDGKARGIVWASDTHVLLLSGRTDKVSTGGGLKMLEFERWVAINRETLQAKTLFTNIAGYFIPDAGTLEATPASRPGKAIFSRIDTKVAAGGPSRIGSSAFGLTLFEVDLDSAKETRLAPGTPSTLGWVVDLDGSPLLRIDWDAATEERRVFRMNGAMATLLKAFKEEAAADSVANWWGRRPGTEEVYVSTVVDGRTQLVPFSLTDGTFGAPIFGVAGHDAGWPVFDPRAATLTGVWFTEDMPSIWHIDEAVRTQQAALSRAVPGSTATIESRSDDGQRMIVRARFPDHPDQFFTFDKPTKKLNMIAASYPALDGRVVAKRERYDFVAADGLRVAGYLTVPKGATKVKMPLIVLPHGGPHARDDQAFDFWSFFYAARGYLVYQPNFRGSSGYGYDYRTAGYGQWGLAMQDDVDNGTRKLIADGIADPARICIVGASYGGYSALMGAIRSPDLYRCAASVNGVTNIPALISRQDWAGDKYFSLRLGSRFRSEDELAKTSPALAAAQIKAPILLVHGQDDTVVPYGQALLMRDALTAAKQQVELITLKGEDHWLSAGPTRTKMLQSTVDFVDSHIGAP